MCFFRSCDVLCNFIIVFSEMLCCYPQVYHTEEIPEDNVEKSVPLTTTAMTASKFKETRGTKDATSQTEKNKMSVRMLVEMLVVRTFNKGKVNWTTGNQDDIIKHLFECTWAKVQGEFLYITPKILKDLDKAIFRDLCKKCGSAENLLVSMCSEDSSVQMYIIDTFKNHLTTPAKKHGTICRFFTQQVCPFLSYRPEMDPIFRITVHGKSFDVVADTGATYSLLTSTSEAFQMSQTSRNLTGRSGALNKCEATELCPVECKYFGISNLQQQFYIYPECPVNVAGRPLLCALGLTISCTENGLVLRKYERITPTERLYNFITRSRFLSYKPGELIIFKIKVHGKTYEMVADTGGDTSVLRSTTEAFQISQTTKSYIDISGQLKECKVTELCPVQCEYFGVSSLHHTFSISPECPMNLAGRDLLCKLGLKIVCFRNGIILKQVNSKSFTAPFRCRNRVCVI